MLVLSRKENEEICIADNITIMIVQIRGDRVRIGVRAPKDIPVHRSEILNAVQRSHIEHTMRTIEAKQQHPVLDQSPPEED